MIQSLGFIPGSALGFFSRELFQGMYGLGVYVFHCPLSLFCVAFVGGPYTLLIPGQGRPSNCICDICGPHRLDKLGKNKKKISILGLTVTFCLFYCNAFTEKTKYSFQISSDVHSQTAVRGSFF